MARKPVALAATDGFSLPMPAITRAFAWTYGIAAALSIAALSETNPAKAIVTITASEVGSDVIFSFSGSMNVTGKTLEASNLPAGPGASGLDGQGLLLGQSSTIDVYSYLSGSSGLFRTSTSQVLASSETGDSFGFLPSTGLLIVPGGYTSGNPISGSSTFLNTTFTALAITPGTYTYTWGTGSNADSAVLTIGGPAAVPGPLPLFGAAAAYTWSRRLRRRCGRD